MSAAYWVIAYIVLQRLLELALARRNTTRLLAAGAHEVGAGHYPAMVGLHAAWIISMMAFISPEKPLWWPALILFAMLQVGRFWVLTTLGRLWTTRIIVAPDEPLVRSGPYRYCRHPNYIVVAGEIAVAPLIFSAWQVSVIFSILNAILLRHRIKIENASLAARARALSPRH